MGTMEERRKKFEKASLERKSEQEREARTKGFSNSFEEVTYTALELNEDKVIRIVGNPLNSRELGSDPKMCNISMILGDNGKKFRCVWPDLSEDSGWILWKVLNKIMSYDIDRVNNNVRRYHHAESHPDLFLRVSKNNSSSPYEKGWRPSRYVLMNVIDRHDMEWHQENSHLKVLSKKSSQVGETFWYEPGVPKGLYDIIWDNIVAYNSDWQEYDVVLRKKDKDPFYEAFHAIDDQKKISRSALPFISDQGMTEEELSWVGYDFDKIFPITSYQKIHNRLGKFIKRVDLDFNTKFSEELEYLAEQEKKEWTEESSESKKTSRSSSKVVEEEEDEDIDLSIEEEEVEEKPKAVAPARRVKAADPSSTVPWDKLSDGTFNGTKYLGVPSMTDEEKSMVLSVKEDGSFEYVESYKGKTLMIYENPASNFLSPEQFHVDPLNGDVFE